MSTARLNVSCLTILLLVGTSGCATSPHAAARRPNPAPAQPGLQCEMQRVTGSLVATRVCTLPPQREAIKQSTRDARDFLDRQVIGACPGSPGCKN